MAISIFDAPRSAFEPGSDWVMDDVLGNYYLSNVLSGEGYYRPPISLVGLCKLQHANPHHGRMGDWKAKMLTQFLTPNDYVSRETVKRIALDYNWMGNAAGRRLLNSTGAVLGLTHAPFVRVRRKPGSEYCYLNPDLTVTPFAKGEIIHLVDYDPQQQIYGIPYWFGAFQSILLGEDSRLFPRKFFREGTIMSNVFVSVGLDPDTENKLEEKVKASKGAGNWKSMLLGFKSGIGKLDDIFKIIPMQNESAKIDMSKLAKLSRDDICAAWGIRPELAGIMPETTGGTGDLSKIMELFYEFELPAYRQEFDLINEFLPKKMWISFEMPPKPTA
jgi:PBSX family phage portal protein